MLILRAFKATEDPEGCQKFLKGHAEILTNIGVNKVTSSKEEWVDDPGTYVLVVEDPESHEVMGGARIDTTFGRKKLPIEEATGDMDPKIHDLVASYQEVGAGEVCGLWNSRKVAGLGFGSLFLSRAAMALAGMLEVKVLLALCAPYTVKPGFYFGYHVIKDIGNEGTFYYPKLDLLATAMVNPDIYKLENADGNERNKIFELREQPNILLTEPSKRKEVTIQYQLEL